LWQRTLAIDRLAKTPDHPAKPSPARIDGSGAVLEIGAGAQRDAVQRTQRHDQGPAIAEADHLAGNFLVISDSYAALAAQADGPLGAGDFHRQALDTGDPAKPDEGGNGLEIFEKGAHLFSLGRFFRPKADFWRFSSPAGAHLGANNLNGGKLNKSNQGP